MGLSVFDHFHRANLERYARPFHWGLGANSIRRRFAFQPRYTGVSLRLLYDFLGVERFTFRYSDYTLPCLGHPSRAVSSLQPELYHSDISVTVRAEERDGLQFKDLTAYLFRLGLCCGIEAQGIFAFTKEGFSYARASVTNIPLWCCGLVLNLTVTFTLEGKAVDIAPRWTPYCDVCLTVYGDVLWNVENYAFEGLALYGYKVRCCLGGCCPGTSGGYFEFSTAFDPARVPGGFQGSEFEYIKIGTCGPGCCGGFYSVDAAVYFASSGSLFGISRVVIGFAVPFSGAFSVEGSLGINTTGDPVQLRIVWKWRF